MTDKIKRSLDFVVRHYRPDAFKADGWFIEAPLPFWRRHAVAASIIGIALAAAAAVTTYVVLRSDAPAPVEAPAPAPVETPVETPQPTQEVAKVEFDDASLSQVAAAIETTYGVKVAGLPAEDHRLTLSYQGTAEDLVATINDLLGTKLTIER